jgi:hypothetical protein
MKKETETEVSYAQCRLYMASVKGRVIVIKGAFEQDKNRNVEIKKRKSTEGSSTFICYLEEENIESKKFKPGYPVVRFKSCKCLNAEEIFTE